MQTITFYSYKGGTGRTLALANVAVYLSRFGQKVCLLDFDLEAPGLHYKFPNGEETPTRRIQRGLVDYIHQFVVDNEVVASLADFSYEVVPQSENRGSIRLIPAGNVLLADYWRKLAEIDWHKLFYTEASEGIPFFLDLKEKIADQFEPDFLLIDSRTGVTEIGGICTTLLPDQVVCLFINNQENIEGVRAVMQSIQKAERFPEQKEIQIIPVLARIPFSEEGLEEESIVAAIQDFLNETPENLSSQLVIDEITVFHSDRNLELKEELRIGTEDTPLLRDYLRLFSHLIPKEIVEEKIDDIVADVKSRMWDAPDEVERNLEELTLIYPCPESYIALLQFYHIRNTDRQKILSTFHQLWNTFRIDDPSMLSRYAGYESLLEDFGAQETILKHFLDR